MCLFTCVCTCVHSSSVDWLRLKILPVPFFPCRFNECLSMDMSVCASLVSFVYGLWKICLCFCVKGHVRLCVCVCVRVCLCVCVRMVLLPASRQSFPVLFPPPSQQTPPSPRPCTGFVVPVSQQSLPPPPDCGHVIDCGRCCCWCWPRTCRTSTPPGWSAVANSSPSWSSHLPPWRISGSRTCQGPCPYHPLPSHGSVRFLLHRILFPVCVCVSQPPFQQGRLRARSLLSPHVSPCECLEREK